MWASSAEAGYDGDGKRPMLQFRIRIDGRDYLLPSEHHAETIMGMITSQVRAGGGFVEIVRTAERAVSVLVSPGMSLSIEVTHVDDQPPTFEAEVEQVPSARSWLDASLDLF